MTAEKSLRRNIAITDQVIICPNCQTKIPLTEAISHQIREKFEAEFVKKEKEIKEKIEKEAKQKAEEAIAVQLEDLQSQITEKDEKLQKARNAELALLKQKRELEESKRIFELEMTRKLDEERDKIRNTTLEEAMKGHRLKDLEKDKQIFDMIKQIDDLKRKAEQGSQQTQGEVLEIELEDFLRNKFPLDHIEPVSKGIRGADCLQKVHNKQGAFCGTIIWESKNAKLWKDAWIAKLKDDQIAAKAEIAVLMTTTLPKDVDNFSYINGAWVTDYASILGLATALRLNLIQVATMKLAAEGKDSKMEVLYTYLSGPKFVQKVDAIVEAFKSLQDDLDQEKRAMKRIWSKREKQIERVIDNTTAMYGDMQGIIGASLPQLKSLELKALPSGMNIDEFTDDAKNEILEPKIPNEESIDEQINTQFIKEKSSKTNEEISEPIEDLDNDEILKPKIPNKESIEDLDEDELKIYNCLKEDFSGEAENGDIATKLRMGSFLVANRFNRLKSKGLVTEIREVEGGIKWKIVH